MYIVFNDYVFQILSGCSRIDKQWNGLNGVAGVVDVYLALTPGGNHITLNPIIIVILVFM